MLTHLVTFRIGGTEIAFSNFVKVPTGTVNGNTVYSFGSDYEGVFSVAGRNLTIPAFYMGAYEVTQRLYKAVMTGDANANAEPSCCNAISTDYVYSYAKVEEKDLRHVENVNWYDAVYFCNKLSEKTGKTPFYEITGSSWSGDHISTATVAESTAEGHRTGYRLPTEAEREYAARGATPSTENSSNWMKFFAGKASSSIENTENADLDSVGWYVSNNINGTTGDVILESGSPGYGTHIVGLKAAVSENLRIFDLSENVFEWCYDWYDDIAVITPLYGPVSSPGGYRIVRGGGWWSSASWCSVAHRFSSTPDHREYLMGFRVVCTAE